MRRMLKWVSGVAFGVGIAVALTIGAQQASASSSSALSCSSCSVFNQAECIACCVDLGFEFGICTLNGIPCLCI